MIFVKKCLDSFFDGSLQNFSRHRQQCLISTSGDNFYSATLITEKNKPGVKSFILFFKKKCPNVNCVVDLSVIALVSISKKKTNLKKCPKPQRSLANCVVNGVVFL